MIKKSTIFGIAGIAAISMGTAFAGGPDLAPVVPEASDNGVYIQGDAGYAGREWSRNFRFINWRGNRLGSFTAGGAIGYQWDRFLAAEFGGFFMQDTTFTYLPVGALVGATGHASDWFVYFAGKLMAPVPWVDNLDAFFKAGIAYRETGITGSVVGINGINGVSRDKGNWRPTFAAGGQYNFTPNWYVEVQYMHVGEGGRVFVNGFGPNAIPALNLFTVGAGYKFTF